MCFKMNCVKEQKLNKEIWSLSNNVLVIPFAFSLEKNGILKGQGQRSTNVFSCKCNSSFTLGHSPLQTLQVYRSPDVEGTGQHFIRT